MKNYEQIGIQIPEILLPVATIDPAKWAVIACDQFTSEPDYWKEVARLTSGSPSTFNLVLPEVYLEDADVPARIQQIQKNMHAYLDQGLLVPEAHMIYVEREIGAKTRKGLLLALDLEHYDYQQGSTSLIRATEGTIVDRLPPRIKIRSGAPLELPHILVLIDDPGGTVIEPIAAHKSRLAPLYDFELMLGSGRLRGYAIREATLEEGVVNALAALADPEQFAERYSVPKGTPVLLFAMGDGNHSLATAKAIWEQMKGDVGMDHPARYALVEIENVHDEGLEFEPIHRVLFGVKQDINPALSAFFDNKLTTVRLNHPQEMIARIEQMDGTVQKIGMLDEQGSWIIEIHEPPLNLAVGSLQTFLDDFMARGGAEKIDYVHGAEVVTRLGTQPNNVGFYLPAMHKHELFRTVILDGALPRKTFSMGEAHEKRFYMEARRIA
jgi:hypothetical protein